MGMGIHHSDQAMGTLGGTVIAFIGIVDGSDILKTGILACVGALVSFGVSKGLHKIFPADVVFPIKKVKSGKDSGMMPGDIASERGRSDEQDRD
ncbi:MAG: hypothetical protein IPJ51_11885 [Saprospiraceae bacterium]|nr:hypothetical protein [Saprospiraceae bacterium]